MKHYPRIILFPVTTISVIRYISRLPDAEKATRILKHPATVPTNSSRHLRPAMNFELRGGMGPSYRAKLANLCSETGQLVVSKLPTFFIVKPLSE